jgi:hypothetical protein
MMNDSRKIVCSLLSAAIYNRKFTDEITNADWSVIYSIAGEHDIHSLLYSVIKDIDIEQGGPDDVTRNLWKKTCFISAINQAANAKNINIVLEAFNAVKIPVVVLKGVVLRDLYSKPELRTMGDIDLHVAEEDIRRSRTLLEQLGYKLNYSNANYLSYVSDSYYIDLHKRLLNKHDKTEEWERSIWNNAINVEACGAAVLTLSLEDHLLFLCLHMSEHLISSGFGLRQLCDFVIFIEANKCHINWDYVLTKAKETGMDSFINVLFVVCNKLFGMECPVGLQPVQEEFVNRLINDVFTGGLYGNNEYGRLVSGAIINIIGEKANRANRVTRLLYLVFPPLKIMKERYEYLHKYSFLLPAAWIHRIFGHLFRKQKVFSLRKDLPVLLGPRTVFNDRLKLLQWLKLL